MVLAGSQASMASTAVSTAGSAARGPDQRALSFGTVRFKVVDDAIARFFYGCNISASVVERNLFHEMVRVLRVAPVDYKPLNRKRMYGLQLEKTMAGLQAEVQPLRKAVLRNLGTLMSDGWDTADRNHLIHFLVGTASCAFFEGTVELGSTDHENANMVYLLMAEAIKRIGALSLCHICTNTCAVMKAAWKLLIERFPWMTATGCGTHVRSL
mmetsp:Transcript_44153/g.94012  ORF Transcript_44153/g.94012 Transcript_44153/m.94012 type:complete len:212 (-) Transcript_44153:121-756(-)